MPSESDGEPTSDDSRAALAERFRANESFGHRIRSGFDPADVLGVLAVPATAIAVYLSPVAVRRSLVFRYESPSILDAFASNYVHFSAVHLFSNLVGYLAIVAVAYLLALSDDARVRFRTVLAVVVVVLPIPLSYLNLAMPRQNVGFGLSGLVLAMFGFLLVELAAFLHAHVTEEFAVTDAPALFFPATTALALPHVHSVWGRLAVVGSLAAALLYVAAFVRTVRPFLRGLADLVDERGYFELFVGTCLLVVGFFAVSFPTNPSTPFGTVNVYIHFVGFCVGFIATYVWVIVTDTLGALDHTAYGT